MLEPGVEPGCVNLRSDDGTQYLLLDWSNYPRAGTRVTVTGYFDNGVASHCMQGKAAIHVASLSTSARWAGSCGFRRAQTYGSPAPHAFLNFELGRNLLGSAFLGTESILSGKCDHGESDCEYCQ